MPAHPSIPHLVRSRWAAIGAAVAVTLGAGGLVGVSASPDTATALTPITPVRILDTRTGDRVGSLDIAGASTPIRLRIAGAPESGIPATGVTGVSLNVTAVDTRANDFGGYLTAYPCASTSSPRPDVSTLNFTSGQTLANAVTVPTSTDGHICIYVYGTAHVLVDANGYYTELDPPTTIDAYTTDETDTLLATKADQTDLDALAGNMVAKADLDALETLSETVSGKADQTDLDALTTTVGTKADQTDLDDLDNEVETALDVKVDVRNAIARSPSLPATVDPSAFLVTGPSIAIGPDGNPLIGYYDHTTQQARIMSCSDPECLGDRTITILDIVGFTDIEVTRQGTIVLAYKSYTQGGAVMVTTCDSADCTGTRTNAILDTAPDAGAFLSLALGPSDNPIVAHYDFDSQDLRVSVCAVTDCSSGAITTILDSTDTVGQYPSVTVGLDGNPVIAYYDFTNGDLKVAACTTPDCTGTPTLTTVDYAGNIGMSPSIQIGTNGHPVIAYEDRGNSDLKVAACSTPDCTGTATITTIDSNGETGGSPSLRIAPAGNPVIVYHGDTNEGVKVAACTTLACTGATTTSIVDDDDGNVGVFLDMTIGLSGRPIVVYADWTNVSLKAATAWWVSGSR